MATNQFISPDADASHVQIEAPGDGSPIQVANANLLFKGDYSRAGHDLEISGADGHTITIEGYFASGSPSALVGPNGGMLNGTVVESLAGPLFPGQYAQSGGAAQSGNPIGEVQYLEGTATATRTDGTVVELSTGTEVYLGDVVETGASTKFGLSLADGSLFSMTSDARMVLNEFVFNADQVQDSSMLVNIVQGAFVFVAGSIAPTGNMKVETPVAVLAIRGTTVGAEVNSDLGSTELSLFQDIDSSHVGQYLVLDKSTGEIIGKVTDVGSKLIITGIGETPIVVEKTDLDIASDLDALELIRAVYAKAQGDQGEFDDGGGSGAYLNFQIVALGNSFKIEDLSGNLLAAASAQKIVFDTPSQDDPPVAFFDGFFTDEDGLFAGNVINNTSIQPDVDPEGFAVRVVGFGEDLIWEEDEYDFNGGVVSTTGSTTFVLTSGAVVEINSAGDFTYNPSPAFDYLALGESAVDSFSYLIADPGNFTDSDTVEVTVYGRNDQPAFAVIDNSAGGAGDLVYETDASLGDALGQPAAISGSFVIADVDTTDVVTATVTSVAAAVVAASGGAVAATASGDGIEITSSDGTTVTTTTITQADLLSFMKLSDVDGDTTGPDTAAAGANSITILSNGETADTLNWNFDSIAETFDFLAKGETIELTYTVTLDDQNNVVVASASDGEVSTATQTITILITGTNDAPEIAVIDNTAGTAGTIALPDSPLYETDTTVTASGSFAITDIDTTDVVTATVTSVAAAVVAASGGAVAATASGDGIVITSSDGTTVTTQTISQADLLSFMKLSDVDGDTTGPDTAAAGANSITILSNGETADTLNWNFDSIGEYFNFLAAGETVELTYTVELDDQNGVGTATASDGEVSTATQTITILITGTNDAPEIAVIDNTAGTAGTIALPDTPLYETDTTVTASGSFAITDIDTTDVVTATVTSVAAAVVAASGGAVAATASGDGIVITSSDGTTVTTQTISQADLLSFMKLSDVDGDTTGPDTAAAGANSITILSNGETADTLNWNFDSIGEYFNFLAAGETVELTYTVELDDQNGVGTATASDGEVSTATQTITILITGTNDAPEIAVIDNTAGTAGTIALPDTPLYETDTTVTASGSFAITDIDTTDVVTATVTSVAAAVVAASGGAVAATASGDGIVITSSDGTTVTTQTISQADLLSFMKLSDVDGDTTGPDTAAAGANSITILSNGETADTLNWNFDSIGEYFNFLAAGETVELTYTVTLDDQNNVVSALSDPPVAGEVLAGDATGEVSTATQTITILITGTNDAPEIAVIDNTAGTAGTIALPDTPLYETDAKVTASGSFAITDIDTTDVVTATVTSVAAAVLAASGGAVAATASGDGIEITSSDGTTVTTQTITQADLLSFMKLSDVDGDTAGPDTAAAGANSITILSNGETADTLNWNFDSIGEYFNFLAAGETVELTYTVELDDQNGVGTATASDGEVSTATQTITILITGTNDAPVVAAITQSDLTEQTDTLALTTDIAVSFTDVDLTDVGHTATVTEAEATGVTTGLLLNEADLIALVTPGTVTKASGSDSGSVTLGFSAASTAFDYLSATEEVTLTYTVAINDLDGGVTPQTFVVTITGTNDAPVVAAITQSDLTEQTDTLALTTDIAVSFTDVDLTDVGHTATVTEAEATGVTTGLLLNEADLIALVTPGTVTKASGSDSGSVTLGFSAASTAFDYLSATEEVTLTYTVAINDLDGGVTPQTFVVTITGTNDAPVVAAITQSDLTEQTDTLALTTDIAVSFTDVDLTDVGHTATVTEAEATGVTTGLLLNEADLIALVTPGTVTKASGSDSGSVTLGFSAASTAFDYLSDTEEVTLTYTVAINDLDGGVTPQTFVVTITGTNDAPVISAAEVNGTGLVEAGVGVAGVDEISGDVSGTWSDVDQGQAALLAVTEGSAGADEQLALTFDGGTGEAEVTGIYGSLFIKADGTYRYVLDNTDAETQALTDGQSVTDSFNYTIANGEGTGDSATSTITVDITGTNDAPTLAAVTAGSIAEDDGAATTTDVGLVGVLGGDDVDSGTLTYGITGGTPGTGDLVELAGAYGTLQLDTVTGAYEYVKDDAAIEALNSGDTASDTFTMTVSDGEAPAVGQIYTVNLTGADEGVAAVASINWVSDPQIEGTTPYQGQVFLGTDGADVFYVESYIEGYGYGYSGNLELPAIIVDFEPGDDLLYMDYVGSYYDSYYNGYADTLPITINDNVYDALINVNTGPATADFVLLEGVPDTATVVQLEDDIVQFDDNDISSAIPVYGGAGEFYLGVDGQADQFMINVEPGGDPATILNFEPDQDVLYIDYLLGNYFSGDQDDVILQDDGTDTTVQVNTAPEGDPEVYVDLVTLQNVTGMEIDIVGLGPPTPPPS